MDLRDFINEAYRNFIHSNYRFPTIIILHPSDYFKFIELMHEQYSYCDKPNLIEFKGMRVIRSIDIEEGKCSIY